MEKKQQYFLVREDVLPEAILKTAQVKELLASGRAENVRDAVNKVGISRSAFYKYRDGIFPFGQENAANIVNLSLLLLHKPGVLSAVLNQISGYGGSILTINQNLPLKGKANVTMSIDLVEMKISLDHLISALGEVPGVVRVDIMGRS